MIKFIMKNNTTRINFSNKIIMRDMPKLLMLIILVIASSIDFWVGILAAILYFYFTYETTNIYN